MRVVERKEDDYLILSKKHTIALYTENADGLFDELVFDVYNRYYQYHGNLDKRELPERRDDYANVCYVDPAAFRAFYDFVESTYDGDFYVEEISYDGRAEIEKEYNANEEGKPPIMEYDMWDVLRGECHKRDMPVICNDYYHIQPDKYYNFDLLMKGVYDFMSGKKSVSFFKAWCGAVAACFARAMKYKNKALLFVFKQISWYLDGVSFMDKSLSHKKRKKKCREIIAHLKHFDHTVRDIKQNTKSDFTTEGVITYISFAFTADDGKSALYRVCIVDKWTIKINYFYANKLSFSEKINYTFIEPAEFDELPTRYLEGYTLDKSMPIDYAARR